jgi:hypothetical protein
MLQTARVFSAMLDELTMDATLQSHHEIARGRAVCGVCHTRYVFPSCVLLSFSCIWSAVSWFVALYRGPTSHRPRPHIFCFYFTFAREGDLKMFVISLICPSLLCIDVVPVSTQPLHHFSMFIHYSIFSVLKFIPLDLP